MRRLSLLVALVALVALAVGASDLRAQAPQLLDSALLSAFRWRSVGPTNMSGRVSDVEGIPGPSKTFYVAAAAGGVWKTTNNGTSFQLVWNDPRVVSMGELAIAPSDSNQVWIGTGEEDSRNSISPGGGVFKSTDGGATWASKGLEKTQAIGRIVVHPTDPNLVYVAALGAIWSSNPERGLYRTRDGGDTWQLVKFISDKAGFVEVILHPHHPEIVWAASWERVRTPYSLQSGGPGSALWKSTDGGDTWAEVEGNGFPTGDKGRIGLAIAPSNPHTLYAIVEAEKEADGKGGNGLYRSTDEGVTWEKMNDVNVRPFYYSQVRVDPKDENRVYFSSTPLNFSDDGGKSYGQTTNNVHVDHHAMWIDPADPDRIVVGNDGGAAISFDRGGNWTVLNHFAIGQFYDVSYNMDTPYRVCGGLQDNGTWCAPSRVASGGLTRYHWFTINGGDGFYSAQDPVDPAIAWAESQGGAMGRNNLRTGERQSLQKPDWMTVWRPYQDTVVTLLDQGVAESDPRIQDLRRRASADSVRFDLRWNWNTPFFQSVHERSWFYAGGSAVVKSTNWGDHLSPISPDLSHADAEKIRISTKATGGITPDVTGAETFGTVVALEESPLHAGWIFAGTDDGRVWRTRDDGANWEGLTAAFKGVPAGTYVTRIEASSHSDRRFYVTFDNHRRGDFTPYLFATDDDGKTFRSLVADLPTGGPDFVHVIKEDARNENLLFVGTDVGAYVSTDRGRSWQRFMNGLSTTPVHDLEIHPRDRELIAATHGRSIWIVDIAPLQELSLQVLASDAHLFQPAPGFQFGDAPLGGESPGQLWFQRPTPGSEARIHYYVGAAAAKALADAAAAPAKPDSAAPAAPPAGAGAPSGRAAPRSPQVQITITAPDGTVFRKLSGPATAGLHSVTWNFRGEQAKAAEPSPWEKKEQARVAERAKVVADSLKQAGWSAMFLDRMLGVVTGAVDRDAAIAMFSGMGGGAGRDPEAFQARPGETPPGSAAGAMDYGQLRTLADLINPGGGLTALFRRFGGTGGVAPMAGPGTYRVTLTVGDKRFTRDLRVEREAGLTGNSAPFEQEEAREGRGPATGR
ncbi:MAG: WD40/YVTN/BNR-like repeat-containing protein [Longimicrobiales bacterium]